MEIQTQRGFGFLDCQPDVQSYCLAKFNYPKECISIHNLPREILEQLKERQLTELLMYISKREGLIYSSLKGMSPGNNFQGDSPVSESEHLKDTFSDFLV